MEEDKAAAYYDELVKKGGGAARFKQGLGYDAADITHPSSCNFVKGRSAGDDLAAIEKEIRLANVRDKLKKRDGIENHGRQGTEERQAASERDDQRSGRRSGGSKVRRSRHSRSRSRERHFGDRPSRSDREKRSRHRNHGSLSRSSSREDNRASSYTSSGQSHDRSQRTREKRRARSRSSQTSGSSSDHRSRRQLHINRARRRSHSGSRRTRRSSRRSRSVSSFSSEDHGRSHRGSAGNHRSSNQRRRSWSPKKGRKEKSKDEKKGVDRHVAKKGTPCDYAKIIPGFDSMTPAERVKAKMKLLLSDTVVKDSAKGMSGEWERFDFNKEAPLDDDAKLDYFGDGIGARDDTGFLQNTGSTFMTSNQQARREAQIKEAHDAAIFGAPISVGTLAASKGQDSFVLDESARVSGVEVQLETPPASSNLLSDQVLAMQQGSWRERALKLKEQRAARPFT